MALLPNPIKWILSHGAKQAQKGLSTPASRFLARTARAAAQKKR